MITRVGPCPIPTPSPAPHPADTPYPAILPTPWLRPDVIVVDPEPAEVHGPDATRQILAQHPRTHVLVLTAAPHGTLAAQTLAAGAQTCLAKSVAYSAIVEAIRAV